MKRPHSQVSVSETRVSITPEKLSSLLIEHGLRTVPDRDILAHFDSVIQEVEGLLEERGRCIHWNQDRETGVVLFTRVGAHFTK